MIVAALEGDCHSPIAALAQIEDGEMALQAAVGARGGDPPVVRASATCEGDHSDRAVEQVLQQLNAAGAQSLLGH